MTIRLPIYLFFALFVVSIDCFSQNEMKKLDSLSRELKKMITIQETTQKSLDSLYKEREKLNAIRSNYINFRDQLTQDSLKLIPIKPGYYCRKLPYFDDHGAFYNEMEWIYIAENQQVQLFITANYEYCLKDMHFARTPKRIRKQIIRKYEKFIQLTLNCGNVHLFTPSKTLNSNKIALNTTESDTIYFDELWFLKGVLIRRVISSNLNYEIVRYNYIGK